VVAERVHPNALIAEAIGELITATGKLLSGRCVFGIPAAALVLSTLDDHLLAAWPGCRSSLPTSLTYI